MFLPKLFVGLGASLGVAELAAPGEHEPMALRYMAATGALISGLTGLAIYLEKLLERRRRMSDTTAPNLVRPTALLLLLATVCTLPGIACTANPATRLAATRELYTATLQTAIIARREGLIDDTRYAQVEAARIVAAAMLDQLDAAINTRFPPTRGQLDAADQAVAAFARSLHQ